MQIILIRHGEPDYTPVDERGFIGQGHDLAPLTENGVNQARQVSHDPILQGSQIIVSSPYTRALQTAAIISKNTAIPLTVEVDLHEWRPDKTYQYKTSQQSFELHSDFCACHGKYPDNSERKWESISEIIKRIDPVVQKYYSSGYEKIIITAHGGIIRRFTGESNIGYCKPYCVEYGGSFDYYGWVD